ncbi:hypothetical protein AAU61_19270 [Desulfocarbo indianensis]|nr:hypothetical protein AAU61_19270 [Desulfocarbo indianensis]
MKRAVALLVLLALAGVGFWATWNFLRGPHWALYQIGKAIHERNPRLFIAYVDVGRIARGQKEELVKVFLSDRPQEEQAQVGRIVEAFMGPITAQLTDKAVRMVADPNRENLPTSWALVAASQVTRREDFALILLSDPQSGRRLRMGMQRHPQDGHWQVVELNTQDLKILLSEYLERQKQN